MIAQEKCWVLRKSRQTAKLGLGLEKSVSAYAGAAVAAGVSLLAMTRSAEAKIVYTPSDTNIPVNNKESILLDLNHDGVADFSLWNLRYKYSTGGHSSLDVGCAAVRISPVSTICRYQGNEIWGKGVVSGRFASALHRGFTVGANKSYFQQAQKQRREFYARGPVANMAGVSWYANFARYANGTFGQWMYTKDRYLGLQFMIDGEVHYGWARLTVAMQQIGDGLQATLTGYAYETIPNKPIIMGKTKGPDVITLEPASLGRLAQGASGVSAWREKK
jgi:hypothetical protein